MTKKAGKKKRIIIILAAILLVLAVPFAVVYHNYTKEICVMESVEHMGQREGVSMDNILVEIEYSMITKEERSFHYLYIFENGDIYSGYCTQEDMERGGNHYYVNKDDRYWDYVYEPCYWGKLSPCDMDNIINEFAQVDDFDSYNREEYIDDDDYDEPEPITNMVTHEEPTYDQDNNNIYRGHSYKGRMERNGADGLRWISDGTNEEIYSYLYNEHAHNAIDIVKSTWAYEQWTNQIFGEGWEERIDLKDELERVGRERDGGWHWRQYWEFVWDSILSLFF